jgi:glutamine amidotransferase
MIAIVDYGVGNLESVAHALARIGAEVVVTSQTERVAAADKLVLPGVGALDAAMNRLDDLGLIRILHDKVRGEGTPILGICLGLQLFTRSSEEGNVPGLGWIDARTCRFPQDAALKVPHLGWNEVRFERSHAIWEGVPNGADFYFAHSYYVQCQSPGDVLATTDYGGRFCSAVQSGNILGIQFHAEKSHGSGWRLLQNFVAQDGHA